MLPPVITQACLSHRNLIKPVSLSQCLAPAMSRIRSLQLLLYLTGLICLLILGSLTLFPSLQAFTMMDIVQKILSPSMGASRQAKGTPVKILLLAYGRTGSSLLADILSSDKNTAFFYEPSG